MHPKSCRGAKQMPLENSMPSIHARLDAFALLITQIAAIDVDPAMLTPQTTLAGDLMLDSISLISLMALTEEHFGVSFSDHAPAVAELRSIGDALALIDRLAPPVDAVVAV
jgi:acyl carrier protein